MSMEPQKAEKISIHTLAWRVTSCITGGCGMTRHFNPHPRVEGDWISYHGVFAYGSISIHTLAWRVTCCGGSIDVFILISIHTLAWRVTLLK